MQLLHPVPLIQCERYLRALNYFGLLENTLPKKLVYTRVISPRRASHTVLNDVGGKINMIFSAI
ncbi:MAG: hypothetical protein VX879_10725, partial [Pseudomonadota bacterium]|nr:hypothetical protein [Pseudomonadota bacterium]